MPPRSCGDPRGLCGTGGGQAASRPCHSSNSSRKMKLTRAAATSRTARVPLCSCTVRRQRPRSAVWVVPRLVCSSSQLPSQSQIARHARDQFALEVLRGPTRINIERAALLMAAEDDALVSNSPVPLPVTAYLKRIDNIARDVKRRLRRSCVEEGLEESEEACDTKEYSAQEIIDAIEETFYGSYSFRPTSSREATQRGWVQGHSGPSTARNVRGRDHPSHFYLNFALTQKRAAPETLAVLLWAVAQRTLDDLAYTSRIRLKVEWPGCHKDESNKGISLVLPNIAAEQMQAINGGAPRLVTCGNRHDVEAQSNCEVPWEALDSMLCSLRKTFWPWPWDDSHAFSPSASGFYTAAQALLDEGTESPAALVAQRTARHRLNRGIATSANGGDLRRALAATERLLLLRSQPQNNIEGTSSSFLFLLREHAIALAHCGDYARALQQLRSFHMRLNGLEEKNKGFLPLVNDRERRITEMLERLLEAMELEGRSRAEHPDDLVVPRSSDAYPSDLPW